jgi:putative tryptophan/tyrosine transport system substrate-binding protein
MKMAEISKYIKTNGIIWAIALALVLITAGSCQAPYKTFMVGIAGSVQVDPRTLKGFKEGLAELGYIEGKNIKYIYREINENNERDIDDGIKAIMAQKVDIILTFGGITSLHCKELVKRTNIPLLFIGEPWPVERGLVERLSHPGGNITGVRSPDVVLKALEWLKMSIPEAKKFYVPYNPDDDISVVELAGLKQTADQLGIKLVFHEVHSIQEVLKRIEGLTEDIDAIFMMPSPTLNRAGSEISCAAIKRGMPTGSSLKFDGSILILFSNDCFQTGKMTARMAHQINMGLKPSDLPVETSEVQLTINLRTAEKIGLKISDEILSQATTIIR